MYICPNSDDWRKSLTLPKLCAYSSQERRNFGVVFHEINFSTKSVAEFMDPLRQRKFID